MSENWNCISFICIGCLIVQTLSILCCSLNKQARLTDGTLSEVLPRISDTDVQISRQRISAFLSSHTAYELLPESGKVWKFYLYPLFWTLWFAYISSNLQTSNLNHKITNSDSDSWPQVVALDVDLPVKQAFHILHEQVAIFFPSQMKWKFPESFKHI